MIAIDTNILVYAHRVEYEDKHLKAVDALRPVLESGGAWGIPWPCAHEFISVVTHPRLFASPTSISKALDLLQDFGNSAGFQWLSEGPTYLEALRKVAMPARVQGGRIHDARIAAICLQHGVRELWSADRDFSSFPQLKVRNPLIDI